MTRKKQKRIPQIRYEIQEIRQICSQAASRRLLMPSGTAMRRNHFSSPSNDGEKESSGQEQSGSGEETSRQSEEPSESTEESEGAGESEESQESAFVQLIPVKVIEGDGIRRRSRGSLRVLRS